MPAFDAIHGAALVRGLRFLRAGERFRSDVGKKLPEIAWVKIAWRITITIHLPQGGKRNGFAKKIDRGRRLEFFLTLHIGGSNESNKRSR